jgi:hypothetical protein
MILLDLLSITLLLPTSTSTPFSLLSVAPAISSQTYFSCSHAKPLTNTDNQTSDSHLNVPFIVVLLVDALSLSFVVLAVYIFMVL